MNGAQQLIAMLQRKGVSTLFGYPGGAIMPVYDALYQSGLQHVLCRHEQAAALAAVGYARARDQVGICLATSGPGATNLITGLADAMLDSVPVVAITGQVAQPLIGTDAFQEVDVLGLSLAVTKHSILVESVEQLPDALDEAFMIASSGRPGPVLIDIPKDIQLASVGEPPAITVTTTEVETAAPRASATVLAQANQLLGLAQRPVAYIGGGVVLGRAVSALRQWLDDTGIPSVTTLKGIGAVAKDYAFHLGMIGMHGTKAANLAVQDCDLLLCLGARFDDRVTGKLSEFAPHAKVIHVDIDAAELGKLRQPTVAIQAELIPTLTQLRERPAIAEWQQHCQALCVQHAWQYDHAGDDIDAPALLHELSTRLPGNSVISCDVGQHQMWVAQHVSFASPHDHLSSSGLGTMGFGLPAAIGAQFARPEDLVINICGDGSFMMNVQELATIHRYRLPVRILLLDNQRLGMVRQWQQLFFEQRYSETELADNPAFADLAAVFGIPGQMIDRAEQVPAALEALITAQGPYLLHVRIDAQANVWPLVPPGASNAQMMEKSYS